MNNIESLIEQWKGYIENCSPIRDEYFRELSGRTLEILKETKEALIPFSHDDLCRILPSNIHKGESIVFQRDNAI